MTQRPYDTITADAMSMAASPPARLPQQQKQIHGPLEKYSVTHRILIVLGSLLLLPLKSSQGLLLLVPCTTTSLAHYRRSSNEYQYHNHRSTGVPTLLLESPVDGTSMLDPQTAASDKDVDIDDSYDFDSRGAGAGLYVHIPYCRRRCRYCDFAIVPIGPSALTEQTHDKDGYDGDGHHATEPSANHSHQADEATRGFLDMDGNYRNAILQEIGLIDKFHNANSNNGTPIPLRSIYFGGGTPSLAPIQTLQAILSAVLRPNHTETVTAANHVTTTFVPMPDLEITIEMDPGTFTKSKLEAIRDMGITRVSLGVQSFDDKVLESIGRCHRRRDIDEAISLLQEVYGDQVNYSLDLISGLPGVSLAKWVETLEIATTLVPRPKHLSLYDLQVESGTVFAKWYERHTNDEQQQEQQGGSATTVNKVWGSAPVSIPQLPSPSDCAFSYKFASKYLQMKGYEHYEISSYAYKGDSSKDPSPYRSRHNQLYWEPGSQWYAVGLGATSSIGGKRFERPRALIDYVSWVEREARNPSSTPSFGPQTNDTTSSRDFDFDAVTDLIMTRLRTSDGLDLDWISEAVPDGDEIVKKVMRGSSLGLDLGLAELVPPQETEAGRMGLSLRLVDPDGFLFSNSIISSIFVELGVEEDCE